MIRLCLIGDYLLTRNAYIKAFSTVDDFGVVGDFEKISDCARFLEKAEADVVLIDVKDINSEIFEAIATLKKRYINTKFIVMVGEHDQAQVLKVISVGASGYVLKNISIDMLVRIIRDASEGNLFISSGALDVLMALCQEKIRCSQGCTCCKLTQREKEILKGITNGKSNTEIGKELCLSPFTVKNYVSKIIEKLEVKDRTQATVKAIQYGLVS